ncbi:hypothetical protein C8Q70DRAFT_134786 [Cubamyces menziesii]|nr:hypothetical protein C8Q70DRAFT_134786 [Cubamyces menziesii]
MDAGGMRPEAWGKGSRESARVRESVREREKGREGGPQAFEGPHVHACGGTLGNSSALAGLRLQASDPGLGTQDSIFRTWGLTDPQDSISRAENARCCDRCCWVRQPRFVCPLTTSRLARSLVRLGPGPGRRRVLRYRNPESEDAREQDPGGEEMGVRRIGERRAQVQPRALGMGPRKGQDRTAQAGRTCGRRAVGRGPWVIGGESWAVGAHEAGGGRRRARSGCF